MKKRLSNILLVLILLAGLSLLLYPTVSDWYNSFHASLAIGTYEEALSNINDEEYERIIEAARAYNDRVAEWSGGTRTFTDEERADYESQLNVDDSGIMGVIDIRKIRCTLPIYHGTADTVLQIAIGHVEGSSLPIGGENTHCVLSGHRGLPSARLFTDIDQLVEGDTFVITTLNEILTYEVDQVLIVLPEEIGNLLIEPGKDLCTLVTCTPYGINTHRLLVRGHRVENAVGIIRVSADAVLIDDKLVAIVISVPWLVIFALYSAFTSGKRGRKRRRIK